MIGVGRISDEVRESFVESGLSHVLAISGLHVGVVCGGAWFVLSRVFALIGFGGELVSMIAALCVGLVYVVIGGCGMPLLRSFAMCCAGGVARYCGRCVDPARVCGVVACVLLLCYPDQWCTPSFALSFITTASIITQSFIGALISLPYSLYFFYKAPLQPFLANIIAVPWLCFVILPTVALTLLTWWSAPACWLLERVIGVLMMIAENPCSWTLHVGYQHWIWIVLWTCAVFTFFVTRRAMALLPGAACVLVGVLRAGPEQPIAMHYRGTFGLWDGSVLWVSKDAWIAKRWSDILGGVEVRIIGGEDWIVDECGYAHPRCAVWFGKSAKYSRIGDGATVRLWKSKIPHARRVACGVRDIEGEAIWIACDR
jgi:competence protein ComEC